MGVDQTQQSVSYFLNEVTWETKEQQRWKMPLWISDLEKKRVLTV